MLALFACLLITIQIYSIIWMNILEAQSKIMIQLSLSLIPQKSFNTNTASILHINQPVLLISNSKVEFYFMVSPDKWIHSWKKLLIKVSQTWIKSIRDQLLWSFRILRLKKKTLYSAHLLSQSLFKRKRKKQKKKNCEELPWINININKKNIYEKPAIGKRFSC